MGNSALDCWRTRGRNRTGVPSYNITILILATLALASGSARANTECTNLRAEFDQAVSLQRVADPRYHRHPLGPWLRSDRFHSDALRRALAKQTDPLPILQAMADMDARATAREHARLAAGAYPDNAWMSTCREAAVASVARQLEDDPRLRERAMAHTHPDAYRNWQRVIGGYVFARPFLRLGAQRWRLGEHSLQQQKPPPEIAIRWQPESGASWNRSRVAEALDLARREHPLGWPWPDAVTRNALFETFAPVVDSPSLATADRIGRLEARDGRAQVDTESPAAYTEASLVRLGSEVLLQLSYTFWFPERSPEYPLDPYAGPIDGLTWRVTLDTDGRPLLWDSIHACGCYYTLFLPADAPIIFRNPDPVAREDPLVLIGPPATARLRFVASPGAHFLRWPTDMESTGQGAAVNLDYTIRPYAELLEAGTRRPPFRPDGLLTGTSRLERLFLFPAGIPDPGAMRSKGHHATAFLGRRHFDDPELASGMVQRISK